MQLPDITPPLVLNRATRLSSAPAELWQISLASSANFAFNSYLLIGEKTALVHTGKPSLATALLAHLPVLLANRPLDYVLCSHVEADESGALSQLQQVYPALQLVCNKIAAISFSEMVPLPLTVLKDGESLSLGGLNLQLLNTPHFPHNWDGHLWYEPTQQWLFSSDYASQPGLLAPVVTSNDSAAMLAFMATGFIAHATEVLVAMNRLALLPVQLLATMHGPATQGPAASEVLQDLAAAWQQSCQQQFQSLCT